LRSEPIDAQRALAIGLVSEVVPAEAVLRRSIEIAGQLADASPLALPAIKANLNDGESSSFADALDHEARRHSVLVASADATEAARAFTDKRSPQWSAR
jgi:enoyl-CoA hydratase/carnithine racemase